MVADPLSEPGPKSETDRPAEAGPDSAEPGDASAGKRAGMLGQAWTGGPPEAGSRSTGGCRVTGG